MRAVGMITNTKSADGRYRSVELFLNYGKIVRMYLTNEDAIPFHASDYGLFEFSPEDQFCVWVDPNVNLVLG